MKAALRVTVLLFTTFRIQQWLGASGLLMLVVAYFVPPAAAPGFLIYGVVGLLLAPALFGGILMRSLSSPRTIVLIPYGRLQILGGMLLSTLIVAGCITLLVSTLPLERLAPISQALLFARVEAIAAVLLLGSFVFASSAVGATLWMCVFMIALLSTLPQDERYGSLLSLRTLDAATLALLCAALWVAFAAWYLRVRFIRPPDDGTRMSPARIFRVRASRRIAFRAYLTGSPSMSTVVVGGVVSTLFLCVMWFVMFLLVPSGESLSEGLVKSISQALGLVSVAGLGGFIVSRRSKTLWLRSGLGRRELFGLCEAQAWRYFAESAVPVLVIMGAGWVLEPVSGALLARHLLFQVALGACVLYLGLMHVKGWRIVDLALAFAIGLSWIFAMSGSQSDSRSELFVPVASAVTLVVAMILRLAALRRWQHLDWVICRPPRAPSQALRAG